jgi:hypothetical protein
MPFHNCSQTSHLIDKFSVFEKALIRVGVFGFFLIGLYAVFTHSLVWGFVYTGMSIVGAFLVLFALCSRCPYPYQRSDCLFLPAGIIKKIYNHRPGPLNRLDTFVLVFVSAVLVLVPQFWLLKTPALLIAYWIFCLPVIGVFPIHYCRRCRHDGCPFNRYRFLS